MARKRPAKRTKARAPSEHSSASTATSRRERPCSSPIHNEQREGILWLLWLTLENKQEVDSNKQEVDSNKLKPLEFKSVRWPEPRQRPRAQERQGDARQPRRLRSGRTSPAQTVTWTRLLNFTAGRRTHTMACAHSELSTGHCGRRIGTKIFQDDSCSPSTRPAERQGVVLSKEQGSLPPSAGNTAAPSRFGELLARVISASFLCKLGFHVDVLALKCSFKGIQEAISEDRSHPLNSRCSRLSRQCTP